MLRQNPLKHTKALISDETWLLLWIAVHVVTKRTWLCLNQKQG